MDQKCCVCLRYACSCLYLIGFAVAFCLCDKQALGKNTIHLKICFTILYVHFHANEAGYYFHMSSFCKRTHFVTDATGRQLKKANVC